MQQGQNCISKTRAIYFSRLMGRIIVFIIAVAIYIYDREQFTVADGFDFFNKFSLLHILWVIWVWDSITSVIPVRNAEIIK